jgi:hypothetical protein
VTAGRDDFQPETSLQPLVGELEAAVRSLGELVGEVDPSWYDARFGEFYDGGLSGFGGRGPGVQARLDAELWFLLDCPLESGEWPLQRIRARAGGRALELLARSELRAWRIESVDGGGVLGALCPLGTGRARLETVRPPLGDVRPGAFVVARSVPIGPGRWALLGRAPVVDREAAGDFDALLAVLGAPRGEFWRVHGGVLARAAWAWPEDREHTVDGEIVCGAVSTFAVLDAAGVVSALRGDRELVEKPGDPEGRLLCWNWRWDPPRGRAVRSEPGVRYTLCHEDGASEPVLAQVVVDLEAGAGRSDLCLLAPTPGRLALAERLLAERLGAALGALAWREVDPPSIVPRWKRAGFEPSLVPLPGAGRAGRARRAA